jgi:hypothetical protein
MAKLFCLVKLRLAVIIFSCVLINFDIGAQTGEPVLYFSDITSGPKTGNSDNSSGQTPGENGAIVTIWGRHLANAQVFCNGAEAAFYYYQGNAVSPANLVIYHQMQKISFQISQTALDGTGEIAVVVGAQKSNALPFTVRPGQIFYVKTTGNDDSGDGSWRQPWQTIPKAANTIESGDIAYICDGVNQTTETDASAAVNLSTDGIEGRPKALVVYPGATSRVGNSTIERAFYLYNWNDDRFSAHWVIAGFQITTGQVGAPAYTGFRVIGNYITAPNGDGMDGAINAEGNEVYILGNELAGVGSINCSKLYHAIYVKGLRKDDPPRAAKESNREIGWNFVHDCNTNRAINMYSEQINSAFIERHSVHDNVILNQRGDGIMLGYYVVGENWLYNNLIIRAGLGPEWPDGESYHTGIRINTGHEDVSQTVVHCYNNTLYGCGWTGAVLEGENGHILISPEALTLNTTVQFSNNIIYSTGQPYLAAESALLPAADHRNCWFGHGAAPTWDTGAINTDPKFVDVAANNFALKAGSPCIDAGINVTTIVNHDLSGTPRLPTSVFDLGVYEFVAPTSIEADNDPSASIHDFYLYQNYPNPFNHTTMITYTLAEPAEVKLQVFALPGQQVTELVYASQTTGFYNVNFNASDLASGVYFYRLEAIGKTKWSQTRKFVFIK